MAIGASPYRMLGSILGEGMAQVGLGLIAGAILSIVAAQLLSGLLFGVSALTIAPYLIVVSLLTVVSLTACLIPARRAMRVDPASALRAEV
jgi:putative ABC transport system permease protein